MAKLGTAVDDPSDPSALTVYSLDPDARTTAWLTMDVDHVRELQEMR
ncbi:MAG: hypothetical protein ABEH64_09350 [Salinirussus sp.]